MLLGKTHCCGAKHISKSKRSRHHMLGLLLKFRCGFAWQAQGILHLAKSERNVGVCLAFPQSMAGLRHVKRIWKDAFCVAGEVQETCLSDMLRRSGRWFLGRGLHFWSIRSSGFLRWFCVAGAALRMTWHHFCVAATQMEWNNCKLKMRTKPAALRSTFHLWRAEFEKWGSLAELFRFWRCQVQKLTRSRSTAAFQSCRKTHGQTDR